MRDYSIAGKRGQWPAPEDTSLSYLILSYDCKSNFHVRTTCIITAHLAHRLILADK